MFAARAVFSHGAEGDAGNPRLRRRPRLGLGANHARSIIGIVKSRFWDASSPFSAGYPWRSEEKVLLKFRGTSIA
jgi:hypothetical protein